MKWTTAVLASLFLSLPALGKEATATVKVKGWHCAGCAGETEAALQKVKGVKSAKADFDKHTVVVAYDDAQTQEKQIDKASREVVPMLPGVARGALPPLPAGGSAPAARPPAGVPPTGQTPPANPPPAVSPSGASVAPGTAAPDSPAATPAAQPPPKQ